MSDFRPPRQRLIPRLIILGVVILAACWFEFWPRSAPPAAAKAEFTVLATFLPVYMLTTGVVGDSPGVAVELMTSPELGCPHNYTVRPSDHLKLNRASVVVANGLGMEPFLEELARAYPKLPVLTISDDCDVLEGKCTHDHGHDHDHEHAVNGHVWVSPLQAAKQVRTIARKLGEHDPSHKEHYLRNAETLAGRLEDLQHRMVVASQSFRHRKIVTMHDAFDYLARDLNLEVVDTLLAEPDTAPSSQRMVEIIEKIKREGVVAVFYEPASTKRIAETIARDAGIKSYELDPLTSFNEVPTFDAYEETMMRNLKTLTDALAGAP